MKKKDVVAMQVRELETLRKELERRVEKTPRWNPTPRTCRSRWRGWCWR